MQYSKGDFFLIEDEKYKANKYIGQIKEEKDNNWFLLNIYIFPEDTINGRQSYMSQFEVFFNGVQSLYQFKGIKEQKVRVVTLEEYIKIKYDDKEKMTCPLYYQRQSYSLEKNIFDPIDLPLICYCQEIFNPDMPFKKCKCGSIFHPDCLLQVNDGKCWSKDCEYNCNQFLSEKEQIAKKCLLNADKKKEMKNITKDMDDKNEPNFLNKKTHRANNDGENQKPLFTVSNEEIRNHKIEKEKDKIEIIRDNNNIDIVSKERREKGRNIIYENLIKGKEIIEKEKSILENYQKYKDNEIYKYIKEGEDMFALFHLKQLSEKIEENLYKKYSNSSTFYNNYLRSFINCKRNTIDLLIKIILGEFTPEKISEFTEYDFLSDIQNGVSV